MVTEEIRLRGIRPETPGTTDPPLSTGSGRRGRIEGVDSRTPTPRFFLPSIPLTNRGVDKTPHPGTNI